ncbi:helix-turn-helix domain-containing protein [Leptospira alexanderi]|uniref:helix-turn-helix domain-containing protein n=1 Tax=Leptospira alexanderi TaxID=100053 RepID=UPI000991073D|nr:helix-turn-helix domain-containing protein [Leptospira alexanderi]
MSDSDLVKSETKNLFESSAVFKSVRKICNRVFFLPFFFKLSKQIQNTFDSRLQDNLQRNILSNIEFKLNSFLLNKGYNDEEFRKPDFAAFLRFSTHPTSHSSNRKLNTCFMDFLNFKRLEESKQLISISKLPHNLLNIAFECGFNSLATFYRSCNKFYNCTPKELHKFFLDNSSVLRKKNIYEISARKLKLFSLTYRIQIFSFLLLWSILRSILRAKHSYKFYSSIVSYHLNQYNRIRFHDFINQWRPSPSNV